MNSFSITRRLITIVLLIELISALCVTALALGYEQRMHFRAFDVLLRGRADSILGAVQDSEDANDNVMLDGTEMTVPTEDVYEVRETSGRLIGKSSNWIGPEDLKFKQHDERRDPRAQTSDSDGQAFSRDTIGGESYRIIRISGLRVVDPGDQNGGVRRYVTVFYGSPVRRVWNAVFRAAGFYAISSLLVLALTGVLMSWLLNRGLAPLRDLASSAAGVSASSWSFSPPQSARMTRELAPLVVAIESVLAGLERSFEQQKRFVGDAAHELKTAVALVKSSLQLLTMKERTPAEYQAGLERCLTDCARMEAMVAQMLTLARAEQASELTSEAPLTEIHSALASVTRQLDPMAQARNIPIGMHFLDACGNGSLAHHEMHARIDTEQFNLLISNLLMNAIQHSDSTDEIRIEVTTHNGNAEIEIRDRGDGIDPSDLPHVFERFSRSDPSRSRNTGGAGLGLAICKAITDQFHGTIHIDSKLGDGTSVIVRLPLALNPKAPLQS